VLTIFNLVSLLISATYLVLSGFALICITVQKVNRRPKILLRKESEIMPDRRCCPFIRTIHFLLFSVPPPQGLYSIPALHLHQTLPIGRTNSLPSLGPRQRSTSTCTFPGSPAFAVHTSALWVSRIDIVVYSLGAEILGTSDR